jgi:UDP-glucose 4-epimerase
MKVLVTGGAGYIGSHTIIELIHSGHEAVIVDNLSNSSRESVSRTEKIAGTSLPFFQINLCDRTELEKVFDAHDFDAVIHFAGYKSVGESVARPLSYYRNNIDSTLTLCELMESRGVRKLIFSSSATVSGTPEELPLKETSRVGTGITNPYGQTKFMIEQILRDLAAGGGRDNGNQPWQISLLRYFNPIGAHESGLIGEDPNGTPNNLLPYIAQVAVGRLEKIRVFGDDYDTPDGTGVRDYIHVVDLAKGHVAALDHLPAPGTAETYNLGTGRGTSVFELIQAYEKACGKSLPYEIVARRPGDVGSCYADAGKAARELGWKAEKSIQDACVDSWRWQSGNPQGYK